MKRSERRKLDRDRREMTGLLQHPSERARDSAALFVRMADKIEDDDPRPSLWLSVRLRLAGVHDAW